jgi:carboxyl-terminal processing protease
MSFQLGPANMPLGGMVWNETTQSFDSTEHTSSLLFSFEGTSIKIRLTPKWLTVCEMSGELSLPMTPTMKTCFVAAAVAAVSMAVCLAEPKVSLVPPGFGGIGAVLEKKGDAVAIKEVIENSPAMKAGLKSGDVIRTIDGQSTGSLNLQSAVELVRGRIGMMVDLEIAEPGSSKTRHVKVTRETIKLPALKFRLLDGSVGLFTILNLTPETVEQLTKQLRTLNEKKARGVVIDFRAATGGYPELNADVAGCFLGRTADLWKIKYLEGGRSEVVHAKTQQLWTGPAVVLVGTNTWGELVGAAFQSNKRGLVVGQRTGGRIAMRAAAPGSSKTSVIANFHTMMDEPVSGKGITPDVVLDADVSNEDALSAAVKGLDR